MDWKQAFVKQARSDHAMLERLNRTDCEYSHRLHYLQMFSEKLAKGLMAGFEGRQPIPSHVALVRLLQNLRGRPEIRIQLRFNSAARFKCFIDSLLDTARRIEMLAPASAGVDLPNPEYPWRDRATHQLRVPCEYPFPEFAPANMRLQKLTDLLRQLLRMAREE